MIASTTTTAAAAPAFTVREIGLYERAVVLRLPFRFGVVTLTQCPQAFVHARIELPDATSAWGAAAELMAPKWFDKNLALSNDDNFDQLRAVTRLARDAYLGDPSPTTAFGHFARSHEAHLAAGRALGFNPLLASYGPALLDALCRALRIPFHDAVQRNVAGIGAARTEFEGLGIDRFLATLAPATTIEARHTVGLLDAITAIAPGDCVNDGLPETLQEVVRAYGQRYFKLKVAGDVAVDLARLQEIAAVLDELDAPYFVSLDGKEQYADAAGIAELMSRLRSTPALARLYASILFVEQPVTRAHALDVDLRGEQGRAIGKPVIIDESDGELDTFVRARERGYAGVSSKTCKGLYKSMLNAARCARWNAEQSETRYFMSAEDLTTQAGLAVQQDLALVNLLGIRHVERNGHHYLNGMAALPLPAQQAFLAAHGDLYERSNGAVRLRIEDGRIALGSLACPGYASALLPDFQGMASLARPRPH